MKATLTKYKASGLYGDVSGLTGDVGGLYGNAGGLFSWLYLSEASVLVCFFC